MEILNKLDDKAKLACFAIMPLLHKLMEAVKDRTEVTISAEETGAVNDLISSVAPEALSGDMSGFEAKMQEFLEADAKVLDSDTLE